MNILDLVEQCLEKKEKERKEIKENSGYFVQFLPCGHAFEMAYNNPYVERAKERTQLDALPLHNRNCPVCNPTIDEKLFVKRLC
jgi:DNA repair exonuclease SbcCD ATPase subunit